MQPLVYKFGGASLKDAAAIRNTGNIIQQFGQPTHLLIVVSAMGKMTNALEKLWSAYYHSSSSEWLKALEDISDYHFKIIHELFGPDHLVFEQLEEAFQQIKSTLNTYKQGASGYDEGYDQVICFGELLSSYIVSAYLDLIGITHLWVDARQYIRTDTTWREGKVETQWTHQRICQDLPQVLKNKVILTQGFIGGTTGARTTTLGREGSDYTASLFANCLDATSVTVWKDVPGILNADPKIIKNAQLYTELSYRDAAEMTFYGAGVIHPKTIKPLFEKQIPLYVRSFIDPQSIGTKIHNNTSEPDLPAIIFKKQQTLLDFRIKDLAFITEQNLGKILNAFTQFNLKIHVLQSSAVSLVIVTDTIQERIEQLCQMLEADFHILQLPDMEIITVIYYTEQALAHTLEGCQIVLQQKSLYHCRTVVKRK